MEMRFDRDLRHNYMVLCGVDCREDYRLRMVSENHPQGLLRCSVRRINNETYLYYEIDSRQPMRNRFADKGLHVGAVRSLLHGILRLAEILEDYLLDIEHILFSADSVYVDMRTEEFQFVYCPSSEEDVASAGGFCAFSESLLEFLDPEDDKAARIVYTLCSLASEHGMRITDMIQAALEEDTEEPGAVSKTEEACAVPVRMQEGGTLPEQITAGQNTQEYDWGEEEEDDDESGGEEKKKGINGLIWAVLFALVFAGNLVIRMRFWLNTRENYLSLAVAGVSIAMTAVSLFLWLLGRKERRSGDGGKEKKEDTPESGPWMNAGIAEAEFISRPDAEMRGRGHGPNRQQAMPEPEVSEETTVLTDMEAGRFSKLYGRGGDETINISLAQLPLTIGKLSGCADFVIRDPSVSRMHTRFFGDGTGKATQMKDLNSTNGTFLNGRRLAPNETVPIRPGDEIGIGRLVFELR